MKNKARFKYNSSLLALLCSKCSTIIKVGSEFTEEEMLACKGLRYLKPQYCDKCKNT